MWITLEIPDHLLKDVMDITKSNTKNKAVVMAMEYMVRRKRVADLKKKIGPSKVLGTDTKEEKN